MEKFVFLLMTILTLGGAAVAVWHRSVVHSAFALMATFFGVAGYFVLLQADFLAVTQVLLYVGGILVLLLFGLMLTRPDVTERSVFRLAVTAGLVLLAALWIGGKVATGFSWYTAATEPPSDAGGIRDIGLALLRPDGFVIPFELASVLLLLALVGAVYIARRRDPVQEEEEMEA